MQILQYTEKYKHYSFLYVNVLFNIAIPEYSYMFCKGRSISVTRIVL